MLRFIPVFLSVLTLHFFSCRTGRDAGLETTMEDSLSKVYYNDAAHLALRSVEHSKSKEVKLPADSIHSFSQRLVEVYFYADKNQNTDSLFLVPGIHVFDNPSLHDVLA